APDSAPPVSGGSPSVGCWSGSRFDIIPRKQGGTGGRRLVCGDQSARAASWRLRSRLETVRPADSLLPSLLFLRIHGATEPRGAIMEVRLGRKTRSRAELARNVVPTPASVDLSLPRLGPGRIVLRTLGIVLTVIPIGDPL